MRSWGIVITIKDSFEVLAMPQDMEEKKSWGVKRARKIYFQSFFILNKGYSFTTTLERTLGLLDLRWIEDLEPLGGRAWVLLMELCSGDLECFWQRHRPKELESWAVRSRSWAWISQILAHAAWKGKLARSRRAKKREVEREEMGREARSRERNRGWKERWDKEGRIKAKRRGKIGRKRELLGGGLRGEKSWGEEDLRGEKIVEDRGAKRKE